MAQINAKETKDEVLHETRRIKESLAESMAFDIDRVLEDARRKQKESGRNNSFAAGCRSRLTGITHGLCDNRRKRCHMMRIVILHPAVPPEATLEDQDSMVQVEAIAGSLRRLGHEPTAMPCTLDLARVRQELLAEPPGVVFNLVESIDGADSLQYLPPALLDALAIRYTGAPTEALFQTTHKLLAKQLMHLAGLPTPAWLACSGDPQGPPLPPDAQCILKAVWEHASRGLDEGNIIAAHEREGLADRLQKFHAQSGRPCFAEQFVEGREFNLSVLGGPASGTPPGRRCCPAPRSISPPSRRESPASSGTGRNGRPTPSSFTIRRGDSIFPPATRNSWPACSTWPGPAGGCSAFADTSGSISASMGGGSPGSWRSTPIRACRPTPVSSPPRTAPGSATTR